MDSELLFLKLSGCCCFWAVDQQATEDVCFFSERGQAIILQEGRMWFGGRQGLNDRVTSLSKDSRDHRGLNICGITLVDPQVFAPEKKHQSTTDHFPFL